MTATFEIFLFRYDGQLHRSYACFLSSALSDFVSTVFQSHSFLSWWFLIIGHYKFPRGKTTRLSMPLLVRIYSNSMRLPSNHNCAPHRGKILYGNRIQFLRRGAVMITLAVALNLYTLNTISDLSGLTAPRIPGLTASIQYPWIYPTQGNFHVSRPCGNDETVSQRIGFLLGP